ncbi:unnamed protein product [Cuscuta epithymum]|uniref:GRF-type domain-containing protein n=1 Tax=Cuscuta epithymum TaxID=186058 RepID=A0AAV0EKN5_9ASTE|nr:unnamed protein product [Cuscuta epithymum]
MDNSPSPSRSEGIHKVNSIDSVSSRSTIERQNSGRVRYCKCRNGNGERVEARLWTSWTDKNPGRRFYGCSYYEKDGCGFFEWHDDQLTDRTRHVINDLKRENRRLHSTILGLEEAIRAGEQFEKPSLLEYDDNSSEKLKFQVQEMNSRKVVKNLELDRGGNMNRNYVISMVLCALAVMICFLLS